MHLGLRGRTIIPAEPSLRANSTMTECACAHTMLGVDRRYGHQHFPSTPLWQTLRFPPPPGGCDSARRNHDCAHSRNLAPKPPSRPRRPDDYRFRSLGKESSRVGQMTAICSSSPPPPRLIVERKGRGNKWKRGRLCVWASSAVVSNRLLRSSVPFGLCRFNFRLQIFAPISPHTRTFVRSLSQF